MHCKFIITGHYNSQQSYWSPGALLSVLEAQPIQIFGQFTSYNGMSMWSFCNDVGNFGAAELGQWKSRQWLCFILLSVFAQDFARPFHFRDG
jgi:hypothetical protein